MKNSIIVISLLIILVSCVDQKDNPKTRIDTNDEVASKTKLDSSVDETLKFIDTYHEILLQQNGDKCGEWGGDIDQIRIYRAERSGIILADYKKIIIDCSDPYSENSQPIIEEKTEATLNDIELKLAEESINELLCYKLTTKEKISHSGIRNYVASKDSTLIIDHWPSFKWPKFRELVKIIEKK